METLSKDTAVAPVNANTNVHSSDSEDDLNKDEEIVDKKDKITRKRISNLKNRQSDVTVVPVVLNDIDRCDDVDRRGGDRVSDNDRRAIHSSIIAPSKANQAATSVHMAKTVHDSVDDKFKIGDAQEVQVHNSDIDQRGLGLGLGLACRKQYNDAFCRNFYFDDYINLEPKPILRGEDHIHAQSSNNSVEKPKGKAESKHTDKKTIEDKFSGHKDEGKSVKSGDADHDVNRDRDRKRPF